MDLIINHGNWNDLRYKLKKIYPQLTDTDLQVEEGMEENMLRMVEYKLRKTKEEMVDIIEKIGYTPMSSVSEY